MENKTKNLFGSTRWKLDMIAASFIFLILLVFSSTIYYLLTIDIIYQATGEFAVRVNEDILFQNFREQSIFLLTISDIIVFIVSIILFDRFVKKMLEPIEYLSNIQKTFAENLSHEIRTPLSIMHIEGENLLNKIENKKASPEDIKNSLSDIQKEIKSITLLLEDLLFDARINHEESKLEKVSLKNLQNVTEEIKDNFKQNIIEGVEVIIQNNFLEQDLEKYFEINKLHLERILKNLISNSFKFTKKGEIKINLEIYQISNKKEYLRILVKDTGVGIRKVDLEKIGDRFFRGKNIEQEISGTGIGVSIIKDLVKKYNFNFEIISQEGTGTSVGITKIFLK